MWSDSKSARGGSGPSARMSYRYLHSFFNRLKIKRTSKEGENSKKKKKKEEEEEEEEEKK